jgi:hypothetical protein
MGFLRAKDIRGDLDEGMRLEGLCRSHVNGCPGCESGSSEQCAQQIMSNVASPS